MKLAIISHTEHFYSEKEGLVGWGPTITEINHLIRDFDEIYHLAFLYPGSAPGSSLPYSSNRIKFIPLSPVGGSGIKNKLKVLFSAPKILREISGVLKKVDVFQFRAPTGMGVFVIPYLTLFTRKKGWFKYAGNWNQKSPPTGYGIQRKLLKMQNRPVTINGKWENQPEHCLTFENPCLTEEDLKTGKKIHEIKRYTAPFVFCFVGRLEDAKGVQRILDAFANISNKDFIGSVHFAGDGKKKEFYEEFAKKHQIPAVFHGFLEREKVFEIYKQSHFFLLPTSASEGFPKVLSEGMNFGCIPITSTVSSINQYINSKNGFILENYNSSSLISKFEELHHMEDEKLKQKAVFSLENIRKFTFEYYRNRIQLEIIKK